MNKFETPNTPLESVPEAEQIIAPEDDSGIFRNLEPDDDLFWDGVMPTQDPE